MTFSCDSSYDVAALVYVRDMMRLECSDMARNGFGALIDGEMNEVSAFLSDMQSALDDMASLVRSEMLRRELVLFPIYTREGGDLG